MRIFLLTLRQRFTSAAFTHEFVVRIRKLFINGFENDDNNKRNKLYQRIIRRNSMGFISFSAVEI